jgi:hypothetical protein
MSLLGNCSPAFVESDDRTTLHSSCPHQPLIRSLSNPVTVGVTGHQVASEGELQPFEKLMANRDIVLTPNSGRRTIGFAGIHEASNTKSGVGSADATIVGTGLAYTEPVAIIRCFYVSYLATSL